MVYYKANKRLRISFSSPVLVPYVLNWKVRYPFTLWQKKWLWRIGGKYNWPRYSFQSIYYTCVFRRPIHSRYPKICTRVSKLMLTRGLRPFLWVLRRRAGRKETVSTTLTRSVTNINRRSNKSNWSKFGAGESLFCQRTETIFFYAIEIISFSDFLA